MSDVADHIRRVSEMREQARHSTANGWDYALSIPEGAYPLIAKLHPGTQSPDKWERWKAWKAFMDTDAGKAFKVKGGF